jgi:hypothetical protein
MKLKSFLIAGILAIPAIFPTNAKANDVIKQHQELARTIVSLGVPVSINTKIHCPSGESGSYFSAGFMVICQDNRREEGVEVEWTENDLDTLRHEAHHLIQDCAAGGIGDRKMSLMFNSEKELQQFLSNSSYTIEQLKQIAAHYEKQGVTGYDLLMELEAFVVAKDIPPYYISRKLIEYCN